MANLQTIRSEWVRESGRYDRVNSNGTDNGANRVINAAIRWLDRRATRPDDVSRQIFIDVAPGEYWVKCAYARVIESVWIADPSDNGARWPLQRKTMDELRAQFPADWSAFENGTPRFWTPDVGRLAPDSLSQDYTGAADYADTYRGGEAEAGLRGVIIMPAPKTTVVVTLFGRFFSKPLVNDNDFNWWTVTHPDLVKLVASYLIERIMRNRSGMEDYLVAINEELAMIDTDAAHEDAANVKDFVE